MIVVTVLDGALDSTKEFLSRLRTQKVTGQDRHERKSTVIWDSNSGGSDGGGRRPTIDGFVAEMYR